MTDNNIKISVVIPIYGVEPYIERCARSLFGQTLTEGIEFIFVDDASPDRSVEILERVLSEYPSRREQTVILRNERNSGIALVRERGVAAARGEYIIHCDSDDWAEPDMYESMLRTAESEEADIVVCDYYENRASVQIHKKVAEKSPIPQFMHRLIRNEIPSFLWNKLIKRELYESVSVRFYPDINMLEDRTLLLRMACHSVKNRYVPKPLYHYNKTNSQSYTLCWSSRHTHAFLASLAVLEEFFKDKEFDISPMYTLTFFNILSHETRQNRSVYLKMFYEKSGGQITLDVFKTLRTKLHAWLLFHGHNLSADTLARLRRAIPYIRR